MPMSITLSYRIVAVVTGAVIAAGVHALAPQAGTSTADSRPGNAAVLQQAISADAQAATVRYWTTGRMAATLRASDGPTAAKRRLVKQPARVPAGPGPWLTGDTAGRGLRVTRDGAVTDAVGKVFFTLDGADYVCSGTLVGGKRPDIVLTAAHCVSGGTGRDGTPDWATNWMFVPGFRDGQSPDGEYTARRFFVAPDWTGPTGDSEQYDVAFVRITAATLYGGSGAAAPPPGLPMAFASKQDAAPADRAYVFGYPALPPYAGLYPNYCAGPVTAADGSAATPCRMTAGDSGGPWLAGFNPLQGTGTVVAVSTYKISRNQSVLYGAVLGPQARALHARALHARALHARALHA
ncbi:MAG: trypsin-like serine peptidase [Trebonia sp.]